MLVDGEVLDRKLIDLAQLDSNPQQMTILILEAFQLDGVEVEQDRLEDEAEESFADLLPRTLESDTMHAADILRQRQQDLLVDQHELIVADSFTERLDLLAVLPDHAEEHPVGVLRA